MDKIRMIYNTLNLLYNEGDINKEIYERRINELIEDLKNYRNSSQKRILNLDGFILILENAI